MKAIFQSKIRRIGSSLGILIPKDIIANEDLDSGDTIEIAVVKPKRSIKSILSLFGSTKGSKPFERDHSDRMI